MESLGASGDTEPHGNPTGSLGQQLPTTQGGSVVQPVDYYHL